MRFLWTLPLAALVVFASRPASAAPMTATYTINAAGFGDILGSAIPPTDPVRLDVLLSFDPAAGDQFDYRVGIAVRRSSVTIGGPVAYDYDSADDILTIGGAGLSTSITAGTNDIIAEIDGLRSAAPTFGGLEYATALSTGIFLSTTGSITVPEPGTVVVLLGGLLGLASIRRRA